MKKYLVLILTLICLLITNNSLAYNPPPPNGYVMDMAGKLSDAEKSQLNTKLDNINKNTKNEFAALIVPSMDGENIEDVSQDTFKSWKVGKAGLDNGVLIVIAVAERKSRIQTGKGVEGDLTDLQANDILRQHLNPHLKQGDFYGGLNETIDSISATIESRSSAQTSPSTNPSNVDVGFVLIFFLVIAAGIGLLVWLMRRSNSKYKEYTEEMNRVTRHHTQRKMSRSTPYVPVPEVPSKRSVYIPPVKHKATHHYSDDSSSSSSSSSSSDSSSSSIDWGSSSSGSDFGGFGGGDSGGGGSSSSW